LSWQKQLEKQITFESRDVDVNSVGSIGSIVTLHTVKAQSSTYIEGS